MVHNSVLKCLKTLGSYILLELSSSIKFSFILGSKRLFFSAINITGPLLGHCAGIGSFFLKSFTRIFFIKSNDLTIVYSFGKDFFNPLVYHIPLIIASKYWFSSNKFIRLAVPMLCMALFIAHPIGREAFVYSWYWAIPLLVHFLPRQIPFFEALGTTFVAHAVGSVLQLYYMPMAAEYWWGLMPVVIVERVLFASGITLVYYGANMILKLWNSYNYRLVSLFRVTKEI